MLERCTPFTKPVRMRYSLLLFFCHFFIHAEGKIENLKKDTIIDISVYVTKICDSLKSHKVAKLITVERSYYGMRILDSLGGPSYYYFLFWQTDTVTYFQKIRYYYPDMIICGQKKVIKYSDIFPLTATYFDSLRFEEFLPFIMKTQINNIDSYSTLRPIHQGFYKIQFHLQNEIIEKEFEDSYLDESNILFGTNLNFPYNNSTKLMIIWNRLLEQIKPEMH